MAKEEKDDFQNFLDELDGNTPSDSSLPDDGTEAGQQGDLSDEPLAEEESGQLDFPLDDQPDVPAGDQSPTEENKVELDLDDADFLIEDEPEPPAATPLADLTPDLPVEEKKPESFIQRLKAQALNLLKTRRKLVIMAGGGLLLLIILAVVAVIFLSGPKEEPKPAPEVDNATMVKKEKAVGNFTLSWDPMWLEFVDPQNGKVRFMVIKLGFAFSDPRVMGEAREKTLILRDAVYYFLANDPNRLIQSRDNPTVVKPVLLGILNQYLLNGQVKDVFFEEFYVR